MFSLLVMCVFSFKAVRNCKVEDVDQRNRSEVRFSRKEKTAIAIYQYRLHSQEASLVLQ